MIIINPFKIPCAYCEGKPVKVQTSEHLLQCPDCRQIVGRSEWVKGGVKAIAGTLMKRRFYFEEYPYTPPRWVWSIERLKYHPRQFGTFEEAVIDAWEWEMARENARKPMDEDHFTG